MLDTLTQPVMLVYNLSLWVIIRRLQRQEGVCPQGAGYSLFFGGIYQLKSLNAASNIAFAITILQATNYTIKLIAELSRRWNLRNEGPWSSQRQLGHDPRIWWLWKLHRMKSDTVMWDWKRVSKWTRRMSHVYRIITFLYIFIAVEITILANHISTTSLENTGWTFMEVLSICSMLLLFSVCCLRYNLLSELIRTPLLLFSKNSSSY